MNAAIISLGSVSSKLTLTAMEKYFDEVDHINVKDIEVNIGTPEAGVHVAGKKIKKYDCIYAKGSFRYNPILRGITSALEKDTYMPIKASAFTVGHDKFLTHLLLQNQGIPMPGTYINSSIVAARKLLERVNYPIILKLPQGTQGKGVLYADSYAAASSILDTLSTLKQPFIVQEYVETGGTDIRAIVVGGKVVAAMKRKAVSGEKRANIHVGGKGELLELDKKSKDVAIRAAKCLGVDVAAVDMLESVKGPVVIELNLSPGLQGIMSATKLDLPDMIAKFLYEKTKKKVDAEKASKSSQILSDIGLEDTGGQEIITTLDIRGDRVLLPKIASRMTNFNDRDEYLISFKNKELKIKKLM